MTDEIANASASELGHMARTALERLRDPMAQLTSAERESLNLARIAAIAEISRRETETRTAAKSDQAKARLEEIQREITLHNFIPQCARTEDEAAAEVATRRHRIADLEREAALVARNIAE